MQHIKTILIVIIFFLLGTNTATVLVYQKHMNRDRNVLKHRLELPDQKIGRYINHELDLDSQQKEKFRKFRRQYNRKANSILDDMQQIRSGMLEIFKSTSPDRQKYEELAGELGIKHSELKELTFDYYDNMLSVLDDTQKPKMSELFEAMLTSEGFAKTPVHNDRQSHPEHEKANGINNTNNIDSADFEPFIQ